MIEKKELNCKNNSIQSVELNLLNRQVEIILRSLEVYGYNLEYMLNSGDSSDEAKQEKIALLKYTYEQILASKAEQNTSKSNNTNNLSVFGKLLLKDSKEDIKANTSFKIV